MSRECPPKKIRLTGPQLEGVALSTIQAVIGDVRYQYLSGPITGGRRLLEWHEGFGRDIAKKKYEAAKKAAVKNKNIEDIKRAARVQREAGTNTIEPGSFEADFKHWGQDDFLRFWENVIRDHAARVLFMDGWEFSSGCAFELLCARKHGVATIDMSGAPLTDKAALALLDAALADIVARHDPNDPRDEEIARLHGKISTSRKKIATL